MYKLLRKRVNFPKGWKRRWLRKSSIPKQRLRYFALEESSLPCWRQIMSPGAQLAWEPQHSSKYMLQLIFSCAWLCFRPWLFNKLTTTVRAFCFWLSYFKVSLVFGPPFVDLCLQKSEKGYLLGWNVLFKSNFLCLWTLKVECILPGCSMWRAQFFMRKLENWV